MKSCSVHNIRFYRPKPKAIYCMSLQKKSKKLALSRSDGTIEIWDLKNSPYIERTFSPNVENLSIEGLGWLNERLFSTGLHGLLIEYDLLKLSILHKTTVTGEAAYCLDIYENNNQIAVGTEQGYLNIFDIVDDGFVYNKFLDKQEGRILCLKYDSTGSFIVSGGLDAIRIWDIQSGHALHKLTTGRSEANKPTIVWCLAVTSDFTIISGDSRGKLTFWDGKLGAQIESYQSHRADILSLCLAEDETNLYCSGVDPNIINFVKIQIKNGDKWVRSISKKIHDHDVRTLILKGEKLYSGGSDSYLAMSYNHPKTLVEYPPILQNPCVTLCKKARYAMFRYPKSIEVWSLGTTNENDQQGSIVKLKQESKRLLALQRITTDLNGLEKKEGIIFSSMSDDGKWIVYGTRLGLRVFQFIYEGGDKPTLFRVQNVDNENEVHLRGIFTSNSTQLITATSDSSLKVYDISSDSLSITQSLECAEIKDTITFLLISETGDYLVAADASSNIICWQKKQKIWTLHSKLPKYSCSPTALTLHPKTSNLLVIYSDNRIIEYGMKEKEYTSLTKKLQNSLPSNWSGRFYPIRNIFYSDDIVILHDDNSVMAIDINKNETKSEVKKKKKTKNDEQVLRFRVVKKYKHLVYMGVLSDNEMVAVEVNPLTLLEQLPPVLLRNKFGTK